MYVLDYGVTGCQWKFGMGLGRLRLLRYDAKTGRRRTLEFESTGWCTALDQDKCRREINLCHVDSWVILTRCSGSSGDGSRSGLVRLRVLSSTS